MLDPYVKALLVDEALADRIFDLWEAELIPNEVAEWAWLVIATYGTLPEPRNIWLNS